MQQGLRPPDKSRWFIPIIARTSGTGWPLTRTHTADKRVRTPLPTRAFHAAMLTAGRFYSSHPSPVLEKRSTWRDASILVRPNRETHTLLSHFENIFVSKRKGKETMYIFFLITIIDVISYLEIRRSLRTFTLFKNVITLSSMRGNVKTKDSIIVSLGKIKFKIQIRFVRTFSSFFF